MDWVTFLEDSQIEYVSRGPNTKKGEISIRCPWCLHDDPSFHLGISLTKEAYGCLRNASHKGRSPAHLVSVLLGCSLPQARLTVRQYSGSDPDTLSDLDLTSEAPKPDEGPPVDLRQFDDFKLINPDGTSKPYYRYLEKRGFHNADDLVLEYDLRYTTTGRWKERVIIPIHEHGKLVGWTGRALHTNPVIAPRYLSSSGAIKTTIFNRDELAYGGHTLFVTEGPMDALKLDYYGKLRARATCVFGTSMTADQMGVLAGIMRHFKNTVLLFDPDAVEQSFNVSEWLPGVIIGRVPEGAEDPGAMTQQQVLALVKQYE